MNKTIAKLIAIAALGAALVHSETQAQTLILSGTNYTQDFNDIGTALPDGWNLYTGATASAPGTITAWSLVNSSATSNSWAATSGRFANHASTISDYGTNFLGTESVTNQQTATNRAVALRQTGSFGDPGAAFVLKLNNTLGFGTFNMSLDLLMLSVQTRSTTWTIDYAIGNTPTGFTPVATFSDPGVFGATHTNITFGSALDNQSETVWIRVVALSSSTGSGSRDTFGIDNVQLGWTNVSVVVQPVAITSQPQDRTNSAGTTATFTVGNSGTAPFTYQWRKDGVDIFDGPTVDGSVISGTATAGLTISSLRDSDSGNYSVHIENSISATNSDPALLTVVTQNPVVTNIAYLRSLLDPVDFTPTDTTTIFTIEGTVTTATNLTTSANAQFYLQDGTAGITTFVGGGATIRPALGDHVKVTGPLGSFNGLLEMNLSAANFTHSVEITGHDELPAPANFDFSTLSNFPVMESSIESSYLVISNVFLQGAGGNFGSGANYNMTNLNGQVCALRIDTRVGDVIGQPIPVFASSIKGVMGQFVSSAPFTGGYQFFITQYSDLEAGTPPTDLSAIPLTITRDGANSILSWSNPAFYLQSSSSVGSGYATIPGATSPYTNAIGDSQMFFRLVHTNGL